MDLLSLAALRLTCPACGKSYAVPLRSILLSHQILHEGCPVAHETECPPAFQQRLASCAAVRDLDLAWKGLEQKARSAGGELVLLVREEARRGKEQRRERIRRP